MLFTMVDGDPDVAIMGEHCMRCDMITTHTTVHDVLIAHARHQLGSTTCSSMNNGSSEYPWTMNASSSTLEQVIVWIGRRNFFKKIALTITHDLSMRCCKTSIKEAHREIAEGRENFLNQVIPQLGVSLLATR
jgi:hypothetical protein